MTTADEQECPRCAEIIKKKAKVCRFCKSSLKQEDGKSGAKVPPEQKGKKQKAPLNLGLVMLVGMLIIACLAHRQEKPAEQGQASEEHTKRSAKNAGTCVGRGNSYFELHDYGRAKDEYKRARSILAMLVAEGHSEYQPILDQIDAKIDVCKRYE